MESKKKQTVKVIHAEDSSPEEVAQAVADALGLQPGDKVEIMGPQFERPEGAPPPKPPPDDWAALGEMNCTQLAELGCGHWDGGLMLLPAEWYDHIPEGMKLTDIDGDVVTFMHGVTDPDRRFGCLSYGIQVAN